MIASNPAFDMLLPDELRFAHGDVGGLVAAIRHLGEFDRNAVGRRLRETVVREHSVEVWAERVVALAGTARGGGGPNLHISCSSAARG